MNPFGSVQVDVIASLLKYIFYTVNFTSEVQFNLFYIVNN